jgi:TIR domain
LAQSRSVPLSNISLAPSVSAPTAAGAPDYDRPQPSARQWDVFVSHASEDKLTIALPLANALRDLNVSVWLDDFELKIGDSLRRRIDEGLARSRFGIVILSEYFFAKNWPQYELDGLVTRSVSGEQSILPIWHGITKAQVVTASPSFADKIARNTTDFAIEEIAKEIASVVRPSSPPSV